MNGVWSHADVKRGRVILMALIALIVAKEAAVLALAYFRGLLIDPSWVEGAGAGWPAGQRGWLILAVKALCLIFTYRRWSGLRFVLGLVYIWTSALALRHLLEGGPGQPPPAELLSLINAVAGFLLGLLLWTVPQLRAYEQAYAPGRVTVPIVPVEARPPGGGVRLLRRIGAFLVRAGALVPGLLLLAAFAYAMNWHVLLRRALAPFLGH